MRKTVLILAILSSFNANAWEACGTDVRGNTANCEYQIDAQGTLTIRGVGENGNIGWWDEVSYRAPWYNQNVTNIVIEDSIKDLGYQGFSSITSTNPVVVPSSVTIISGDAFKSLLAPEVIIPDTVTSIGSFSFCFARIKKITIPDSVTSIGESAFAQYSVSSANLTEIIVPDTVVSIGKGAFSGQSKLQTLTIGENTHLNEIFGSTIPQNLKIYCTGDTAKCDANLEAAGYGELKSIKATTKQVNGVTYVYDNKGRLVTTSGKRKEKRIYTIDEANTVAGKVNSVKIRYR